VYVWNIKPTGWMIQGPYVDAIKKKTAASFINDDEDIPCLWIAVV
jgi:hypothetical protein